MPDAPALSTCQVLDMYQLACSREETRPVRTSCGFCLFCFLLETRILVAWKSNTAQWARVPHAPRGPRPLPPAPASHVGHSRGLEGPVHPVPRG